MPVSQRSQRIFVLVFLSAIAAILLFPEGRYMLLQTTTVLSSPLVPAAAPQEWLEGPQGELAVEGASGARESTEEGWAQISASRSPPARSSPSSSGSLSASDSAAGSQSQAPSVPPSPPPSTSAPPTTPSPAQSTTPARGGNQDGSTHLPASSRGGWDILLLVGQSNMAGFAGAESEACYRGGVPFLKPLSPQLMQWHQPLQRLTPAEDPMNIGGNPGYTGPALAIGNSWLAAQKVGENRSAILVNSAVGSTGLAMGASPPWAAVEESDATRPAHGKLYRAAIRDAQAALAAAASGVGRGLINRFAGILWIQGEEDGMDGVPGDVYARELRKLIAGMRAALQPLQPATERQQPLPFIIGGIVPDFRDEVRHANPTWTFDEINRAHEEVAASDPASVFVPGPRGNTCFADKSKGRPLIHYVPEAAHALGRDMATALLTVRLPTGRT